MGRILIPELPKIQIQVKSSDRVVPSRAFTMRGIDVDEAMAHIETLFKKLEECDGSIQITHYRRNGTGTKTNE